MSKAGQPRSPHSEGRELAAVAGSAVFGTLSWSVAGAGEGRLALVTGALSLACLAATGCFSRRGLENDRTPPGEIARMSEAEFDRLEDAVEGAAATLRSGTRPSVGGVGQAAGDDFESLVRDALDELPAFLQSALEDNVAVLVSDDGDKYHAYGYYFGGTVANSDYDHHIYIFRDTLVRDFGSDPEELRRQVTTTVRHEVAHHLGAGERHVAGLGL